METALIRLEALTVRYPDFRLGPLDLTLRAGERVALIGANGSGKSTTLRVLGGRERSYGGRVLWRGLDLRSLLPDVRARIGLLPERFRGFGWMTVAEHLRFLSEFHPTWDRAYEDELVERLRLPRGARVGTLSRGTRVKLSFVAAESFRPPVLLLDEPTAGLDPLVRGELLELLASRVPAGGRRLLVYSSHILEDVTRICDRVLVLVDGALGDDLPRGALGDAGGSAPGDLLRRRISGGGEVRG